MFYKTPEHDIIESLILEGKNTLVNSGPGTGKTTMIAKLVVPALRALKAMRVTLPPRSGNGIAMTLNWANANELKLAVQDDRIECATCCATGWRLLKKAYPMAQVVVKSDANPKFRKKASEDKMTYLVDELFQKESADGASFEIAVALVSHAKKAAFGIDGHPSIDDRDAWKVLASRYLANAIDRVDETGDANAIDEQITYAIKLLKASNKQFLKVNFDDQVYLPLLLDVVLPPMDFIIFDEFQDVKPIELEYLARYSAKGTQIIGVGDYHQYAYEFAGALYKAFDVVQEKLDMALCNMKTSWRCSHAAAELANGVFPDSVYPAPNAKQGVIATMEYFELFDKVGELNSDHGLLSRTHKHLMPAAMKLLAAKQQFWYKGVKVLVKRMRQTLWHQSGKKSVTDLTVIRQNLSEYQEQCETKHVTAAGTLPKWVGNQRETIDCLNLLLVNCEQAGEGLDCVNAYLKTLEESERKTLNGPALCTIHVSKGLQWSNVYVIGPCQSTLAVTEEQLYAEKCLEFVAYSRSSENVTIISLETKATPAE